jgi:hypothetical protein
MKMVGIHRNVLAVLDILPGLKAGDSYRVARERPACNRHGGFADSCFGDPPGMIPATADTMLEAGSIHRPSGVFLPSFLKISNNKNSKIFIIMIYRLSRMQSKRPL